MIRNSLILRVLLMTLISYNLQAQCTECFITTWQTNNAGTSNSTSITIPTLGGETYSYDVDWDNNGVFDDIGVTGDITHSYGSAGEYQVAIRGQFPSIFFNNGGDKEKIVSIDQWGSIAWVSMERSFFGCSNLEYTATDAPDLSAINSLFLTFGRCSKFDGDLNSWDISTIESLRLTFLEDSVFNSPLNNWDTKNVTNMNRTFGSCTSFNQPLETWKVDSVVDMSSLFSGASMFDQPLSSWNTIRCKNMSSMFENSPFNQNIDNWSVDSVLNFQSMFEGATSYNQPLNNWEVRQATNMSSMFKGATQFNQPLDQWETLVLNTTAYMFEGAEEFNQKIEDWNTSSVQYLEGMFKNATSFNRHLNNWEVSNVLDMSGMFEGATAFNKPLEDWKLNSIIHLTIAGFRSCETMFDNSGMDITNYDKTITGWASNVDVKSDIVLGSIGRFYCNSEVDRDFLMNDKNWTITGDTKDCQKTYFITTWDTEIRTEDSDDLSIQFAFRDIEETGLFRYDFDWENDGIFDDTYTINAGGIITHEYDTPGVYQVAIRPNESTVNQGGNRIGGFVAFDFAEIISVDQWGSLEWKAALNSFGAGIYLIDLPDDQPNFGKVEDFRGMFKFCERLVGSEEMSNWDVSSAKNTDLMFLNATVFNQDISNWDVSNDTSMIDMFRGCQGFDHSLANWDLSSVEFLRNMLHLSGMSTDNYDKTLIGWYNNPNTPDNLYLGSYGLYYCLSKTVRDELITNKGWNVFGDLLKCTNRWEGTEDIDWYNTNNWSLTRVPTIDDDVVIDLVPNQPHIVNGDVVNIMSLNLNDNTSLTINGVDVNIIE